MRVALEEIIRKFIAEELVELGETITVDTSLFKGQILDSMNLSELVGFLEDEFSIKVSPMEIVFENFDTVQNMVEYIKKKQSAL